MCVLCFLSRPAFVASNGVMMLCWSSAGHPFGRMPGVNFSIQEKSMFTHPSIFRSSAEQMTPSAPPRRASLALYSTCVGTGMPTSRLRGIEVSTVTTKIFMFPLFSIAACSRSFPCASPRCMVHMCTPRFARLRTALRVVSGTSWILQSTNTRRFCSRM